MIKENFYNWYNSLESPGDFENLIKDSVDKGDYNYVNSLNLEFLMNDDLFGLFKLSISAKLLDEAELFKKFDNIKFFYSFIHIVHSYYRNEFYYYIVKYIQLNNITTYIPYNEDHKSDIYEILNLDIITKSFYEWYITIIPSKNIDILKQYVDKMDVDKINEYLPYIICNDKLFDIFRLSTFARTDIDEYAFKEFDNGLLRAFQVVVEKKGILDCSYYIYKYKYLNGLLKVSDEDYARVCEIISS